MRGAEDGGGPILDVDVDWSRAFAYALTVAVVLTVGVAATTSTTAFDPFNPGWEGATQLQDQVAADPDTEREILRDGGEYDSLPADGTVAFVVGPEEPYTADEADRIERFVADGATLIVLDNEGEAGNDLLASVGADARVDGRLLRDETHYDEGPLMPVARPAGDHEATAGVERLTLNYASAVDPGGADATVLATTSEYARFDGDNGGIVGQRPVATVESVGDGRVVVVGDPSVTINAMIERADNEAFLGNLYADADRAVFDVSHGYGDGVPPLSGAVVTLRQSAPVRVAVGVLAVVGLALATSPRVRGAVRRARERALANAGRVVGLGLDSRTNPVDRPGLSAAEQVAYLRERHPEWSDERVERVRAAAARTTSTYHDTDHE